MTDVTTVPIKTCCGALPGDQHDCLTPAASAGEMAQLLRERPPIVLPTGPAAEAAIRRADTTNPLLIAMRAAAVNRYDSKGQPR